eukprot:SAG31_NODE_14763_length_788_cov_3.150943_2_plen_96_part_01
MQQHAPRTVESSSNSDQESDGSHSPSTAEARIDFSGIVDFDVDDYFSVSPPAHSSSHKDAAVDEWIGEYDGISDDSSSTQPGETEGRPHRAIASIH